MNDFETDNSDLFPLYVGIDDTDSVSGMCTTYICSVILDRLKDCGFKLDGPPRLVRLNPFAPHKTRGNGAVSFKLILKSRNEIKKAKKIILKMVQELAVLEDPKTNPGLVFFEGDLKDQTKVELREYALKTIRTIIKKKETEKLAKKLGFELFGFKKGMGVIGALAAVGCPMDDATYELLAYRDPLNYGKKRKVDLESVREMDRQTYPDTFDNLDNGYMAITPHTPCPVLYGIRGETFNAVLNAMKLVKVSEPIKGFLIFLTNQHTDLHLQVANNISQMEKFQCYIVKGVVKDFPVVIEGGHVIFTIYDSSGEVECAAYEPTKDFREIVRQIAPGDHMRVYGGIGMKGTLNLEKIQIITLASVYEYMNPFCQCGRRMKSAGTGKGYKCPGCGKKMRSNSKEKVKIERKIKTGFYEVPPSARRHLSKPLIRGM